MANFQGIQTIADAMTREDRAQEEFMVHVRDCNQCYSQPSNICETGRELIRKVIEIWEGEVCKCGELPNHCSCEKD